MFSAFFSLLSLVVSSVVSPSAFAAAPKILFIGDSHVGGVFGRTLDQLLVQIPEADVATYSSSGSIARGWLQHGQTKNGSYSHVHSLAHPNPPISVPSGPITPTPQITSLLHSFKPTHLIVELGTNYGPMIRDSGNSTSTRNDLKIMISVIRKAKEETSLKCFWISLPDSRNVKPQVPMILEETQKAMGDTCEFFDSVSLTHYPQDRSVGGDGLHYGKFKILDLTDQAVNWAQSAYHSFVANYFPDLDGRP